MFVFSPVQRSTTDESVGMTVGSQFNPVYRLDECLVVGDEAVAKRGGDEKRQKENVSDVSFLTSCSTFEKLFNQKILIFLPLPVISLLSVSHLLLCKMLSMRERRDSNRNSSLATASSS